MICHRRFQIILASAALLRRLLFLAAFVIAVTVGPSGYAEPSVNPESVLVSRFNFARPEDWQWVETLWEGVLHVQQSVTFRVIESDPSGDCVVYINFYLPDRPAGGRVATAKRWKESFTDVPGPVAFGKPVVIGTNNVSYLELTGTFRPANKKLPVRKNFTMYGAIVDDPAGNVVLRIMGDTAIVRKAKPHFRKMIEDALKQE